MTWPADIRHQIEQDFRDTQRRRVTNDERDVLKVPVAEVVERRRGERWRVVRR
jgi:hypothetical protein